MSKLASLHSQLSSLKTARASVRLATAFAALATAVLWALIGVFLLDVYFELPLIPRLIVMTLGALATFWGYMTYTQPMLGVQESELDMALMVERQQKIDSDLVAALQFESPVAPSWGSTQLETAVIDYVAEFGRGLNVFEGFSREQMVRRGVLLGATVLVVAVFAAVAPAYASVFFNRLMLGTKHYPTDTIIEQILVNDSIVLKASDGARPETVKGAEGHPMLFYVQCSGTLPTAGELRIRSAQGGSSRLVSMAALTAEQRASMLRSAQAKLLEAIEKDEVDIAGPWRENLLALTTFDAPEAAKKLKSLKEDRRELRPVLDDVKRALADWPAKADRTAVYLGDMGRLVNEVRYGIKVNDAWTDPAQVKMIPLPVVELVPHVTPPAYAQAQKEEQPTSRQISVLEGSDVRLDIQCVNKKPLKEAWLIAKGKDNAKKFKLTKTDKAGLAWGLNDPASPLKKISQEIRFEIQVADGDGLSLESPIKGIVRLRPDRPPSGSADVVHRVILPIAKPIVHYRINDDYGISKLALQVAIERNPEALAAADPEGTKPPEADKVETFLIRDPAKQVYLPTPDTVRGEYELDIASLKLAKGDRLKLTLEITDYRGDVTPGETYLSDPLVLEISDESGVLAAISEADERSEQRLTDIIKKQLGIGESP